MTQQQQGDVLLFQTTDDGEINVSGGLVEMSGGLDTAAYLSLFGGNEDDDGLEANPANWWGNIGEIPERQYHSRTQNLLQSIPAVTGNLRRIEDAAKQDLSWFVASGAAISLEVVASMPGLNKIKIEIRINGDETLTFVENWTASL